MSKYIECPHCGGKFPLNNTKGSRTKKSGFFDAYDQEADEIVKLLQRRNIELGKAVKNESRKN